MDKLLEHGERHAKLSAEELFGLFSESNDFIQITELFEELLSTLGISKHESDIYKTLKTKLTSWKCQSLWDLIDVRTKHAEYERGKACQGLSVLVIGAGPIGLRTAIETAFLGCRTVVVEKRTSFTRNNVLHLWPFLLSDFRSLGAKKFYGKFCAGSIDHISKIFYVSYTTSIVSYCCVLWYMQCISNIIPIKLFLKNIFTYLSIISNLNKLMAVAYHRKENRRKKLLSYY